MLKIGRNDPCPCGSGKKYKKCCLHKATSPVASLGQRKLRRVESELVPALMKHAEKYYGPGTVKEAWDEFTLWDEVSMDPQLEPDMDTLFFPWFLFNWIPGNIEPDEDERYPNMQIARHYLEHNSAQIDSSKRQFIEEACSQPHSFFMVTDVVAGKQLTLRDLLLQREVTVQELQGSTMLGNGAILYARTITIDDCSVMLGCGQVVIPPSYIDDFIATREEFADECPGFGKDYLLACDFYLREMYFDTRYLALNSLPPELQNTDGEPLQLTTLNYDLNCPPGEALAALAGLALVESAAELEQTGKSDQYGKLVSVEFPWLKKGNEKHEDWEKTVLGHLSINGAELTVNVNSQERASAIKRRIGRRLGQRAQFRDQEVLPVEDMLEEMQIRPPDEKEETARRNHAELAALPEVKERVQEMAEAHWESWPDKPLPILRHQTPREAAKTATGRERLEALFWNFEWEPAGDNAFAPDIPRLKKTLGMK